MKVIICVSALFFILSNYAWASDPSDPGKPDTVYLEYGGISKGTLTIKVIFVTDNIGDTNKLAHLAFPLEITNSNPAAKPVLDTTVAATYSGSAVGGWSFKGTHVRGNERNPGIFPLTYWLTAFDAGSSLKAGRYHFANIVLRLQDTTTICIDTFLMASFRLRFTKVTANAYTPQWKSSCFHSPGSGAGPGSSKNKGKLLPNSPLPDTGSKKNPKKPGL